MVAVLSNPSPRGTFFHYQEIKRLTKGQTTNNIGKILFNPKKKRENNDTIFLRAKPKHNLQSRCVFLHLKKYFYFLPKLFRFVNIGQAEKKSNQIEHNEDNFSVKVLIKRYLFQIARQMFIKKKWTSSATNHEACAVIQLANKLERFFFCRVPWPNLTSETHTPLA